MRNQGLKAFFSACCLLVTVYGTGLSAQKPPSAEEAMAKVLAVLSGAERNVPETPQELLSAGAWEALAYLEQASLQDSLGSDDLREAVPDYYRFRPQGQVILKLIDPADHNRYGVEMTLRYAIEGNELVIMEAQSGVERDRWHLLYLDAYYLALDLGDLRLFFTRTRNQEP